MTPSDDISEHRVREIAYKLWEDAGKPFGQEAEFWRRAREEASAETRKRPVKTARKE